MATASCLVTHILHNILWFNRRKKKLMCLEQHEQRTFSFGSTIALISHKKELLFRVHPVSVFSEYIIAQAARI